MEELIILVADKDTEQLLLGLLPKIIKTEQLSNFNFRIFKHPQRDGGVRTDAVNFVRTYLSETTKLFIVFDYEGSGEHSLDAQGLETKIENELIANGWQQDNVCVCIIDPELENWVWVSENAMNEHLNLEWKETQTIKNWLEQQNPAFIYNSNNKPTCPKEAFEKLLEHQDITWSSSVFKKVANCSYKNCQDRAFLKMLNQLKIWFS